jgi:hypothetical protein
MGAVRFVCSTDNKASHYEIHQKVSMAGGAIAREKIRKDTSTEFDGEMEIVCEGGTLYRELKDNGLTKTCYLKEL